MKEAPPHGWTCFHCGENFTDGPAAQEHFGGDRDALAACQVKASERGLVGALRKAEARIVDYRIDTGQEIEAFAKAILHGDEEHRAWLTEAAGAFIAGAPMPPPRGRGTSSLQEPSPHPSVPRSSSQS